MNLVASPKRAGKPATPKKVELCLVPGVHTTYKGQTFCAGWSGLFLSAKQMYSRVTADDDGAIRYLSGLIAKDPVNHPKWEKELHEKLAPLGVYSYETPGSPDNLTSCSCELFLEDTSEQLTAPGAWTFQCMAYTLPDLLQMLKSTIDITILGQGGWAATPGSKILTRTATGPSNTWQEAMMLTLVPQGSYELQEALTICDFARHYEWMQWNGSWAHVPRATGSLGDKPQFPFEAASVDFIQMQATQRVRDLVLAYNGKTELQSSSSAEHPQKSMEKLDKAPTWSPQQPMEPEGQSLKMQADRLLFVANSAVSAAEEVFEDEASLQPSNYSFLDFRSAEKVLQSMKEFRDNIPAVFTSEALMHMLADAKLFADQSGCLGRMPVPANNDVSTNIMEVLLGAAQACNMDSVVVSSRFQQKGAAGHGAGSLQSSMSFQLQPFNSGVTSSLDQASKDERLSQIFTQDVVSVIRSTIARLCEVKSQCLAEAKRSRNLEMVKDAMALADVCNESFWSEDEVEHVFTSAANCDKFFAKLRVLVARMNEQGMDSNSILTMIAPFLRVKGNETLIQKHWPDIQMICEQSAVEQLEQQISFQEYQQRHIPVIRMICDQSAVEELQRKTAFKGKQKRKIPEIADRLRNLLLSRAKDLQKEMTTAWDSLEDESGMKALESLSETLKILQEYDTERLQRFLSFDDNCGEGVAALKKHLTVEQVEELQELLVEAGVSRAEIEGEKDPQ